MNALLDFFDQSWDLLLEMLSSTSLQMFLLVGSGLLAVSLLVLAMTRWGHSRPVWKCVVLSVGAHILLMGYAYGTRMVYVTPEVKERIAEIEEETIEMNLIGESEAQAEEQKRIDAEGESWNQFVNTQPLPQIDKLPRAKTDSKILIERQTPDFEESDFDQPDRMEPLPSPVEGLAQSNLRSGLLSRLQDRNRGEAETFRVIPPEEIPVVESSQTPKRDELFSDLDQQTRKLKRPIQLISQAKIVPEKPELDRPEIDFKIDDTVPQSVDSVPATGSFVKSGELPTMDRPAQPLLKVVGSNSTRRLGDGQPIPSLYSLRNASRRMEILKSRGGSIKTEQAVEAALEWLSKNQETNGSWNSAKSGGGVENRVFGHDRDGAGANADTGITGLAILAYLAGGHSQMEGPYQKNVRHGLDYLIEAQDSSGSFAGGARMFARMYCHSMALLAISEAWALTGDPKLEAAVKAGTQYTLLAQNSLDGGWRYQPGDSGDMSQFGWQVMALHSAELAGLEIPQKNKDLMAKFIEGCAKGPNRGLAAYRPGQGPNTVMTAESFVARKMLGQKITDGMKREATFRITGELPSADRVNLYYWYYGTMAMYFSGGPEWDSWNDHLKQTLISAQSQDGTQRGSWEPDGIWGSYGGRVYSTSMAALMLQVYYRYLPTSQQ